MNTWHAMHSLPQTYQREFGEYRLTLICPPKHPDSPGYWRWVFHDGGCCNIHGLIENLDEAAVEKAKREAERALAARLKVDMAAMDGVIKELGE